MLLGEKTGPALVEPGEEKGRPWMAFSGEGFLCLQTEA